MPKLKIFSGSDVVRIFLLFGFTVASQKGSHVKLQKFSNNLKQTLTIPLHDELDKGTVRAIYRQARLYVPEFELFNHFYTE